MITAYLVEDFRRWLKKHHTKESKVVVVVHKKHTGKPFPTHRELIEEAICWGWIDTTIKRLDEDTFVRHFSKRTEKSKWSDNTLSHGKRLLKEGRMSAEGIRFYKMGKAKSTHDHGIPKNPDKPAELKKALAKNTAAQKAFQKYLPSITRALYRWILRGKQEETREKRIKQIVASTLAKKAHPLRPQAAAQG